MRSIVPDILAIAAIGCAMIAGFIITIFAADARGEIREIEQANAKYYTSEVIRVDIERNRIELDNGTVLYVGDKSPTVGDIIKYGETDDYDSTVIPNRIFKTGNVKHINKEIVGQVSD